MIAMNDVKAGAKRFSVKASLVLGGVLVSLFIVEVALRVAGFTYPVFYTTDEYRGVALRAGMQGWYRKEGAAYIRINSDGLRDREHTKTKPANTLRIAVLGDSYAEALQVQVEETFWAVLERKLKECDEFAGKNIEVINFGVSGYGTAQELITLQRFVRDYSPDIVLLAITTNNDITDNSRTLKRQEEIPYYVYSDGHLVLDASFRDSSTFRLRQSALNRLGRWIRDSSRVIQALHQAHYALKSYFASRRTQDSAPKSAPSSGQQGGVTQLEEPGIDNLIYREPRDDVWRDAWRVTEALIVQMRDEVRSKGAKFLVVTLSNGIQVHPSAALRQEFMRRVESRDLFYPDMRIKALCEREGIAVVTLAPSLQAYAEQHKVFLHGFGQQVGNGHWNALGHRVAGELISQKLCEGIER